MPHAFEPNPIAAALQRIEKVMNSYGQYAVAGEVADLREVLLQLYRDLKSK